MTIQTLNTTSSNSLGDIYNFFADVSQGRTAQTALDSFSNVSTSEQLCTFSSRAKFCSFLNTPLPNGDKTPADLWVLTLLAMGLFTEMTTKGKIKQNLFYGIAALCLATTVPSLLLCVRGDKQDKAWEESETATDLRKVEALESSRDIEGLDKIMD